MVALHIKHKFVTNLFTVLGRLKGKQKFGRSVSPAKGEEQYPKHDADKDFTSEEDSDISDSEDKDCNQGNIQKYFGM